MVLLRNQASNSYSTILLSEIRLQGLSEFDDIVTLFSGEEIDYVHRSILSRVSPFLHNMFSSSCYCQSNVLILPLSPPSTLASIVALIYNGVISGIDLDLADQVILIARLLGIDIRREIMSSDDRDNDCGDTNDVGSKDNSGDILQDEVEQNIQREMDDAHAKAKQLKIKTKIVNKKEGSDMELIFPKSRLNRDHDETEIEEKMDGFLGRIQVEYNNHPVGQYMGPYDQNKDLKLSVQLPDSDLDYLKYTEFNHSGDRCYKYYLKSYNKYDDLNKIESYRIASDVIGYTETDAESSDDQENDLKHYSCQLGKCCIPCPCPLCHLNDNQCKEHKIKHVDLFDEKNHAVSIKSTEKFCKNKGFLSKSYIIKYPGIPLICKRCKRDLLFHHYYHFAYHDSCRFCKPSWYKYKAKTANELKSLEKKEDGYFKTVCPHCDKQFMGINEVRRHIKHTHDGHHPFKCGQCDKVFNSAGGKEYHEQFKHSSPVQPVNCDSCKKSFKSDVALKAHLKYAHSEVKSESCIHCEAKFKQKKNLRAHLANIHGINQLKENYCEASDEDIFKCDKCDAEFLYKRNLDAHMRRKHQDEEIHECEKCKSKFSHKRTLVAHVKAKHVNHPAEFACSDCGKKFSLRKNMLKHMKAHRS